MRTVYTDLNIRISIEQHSFLVLNIVFEKFMRSMPRHSHGHNSYELHYIPYGHGTVFINNQLYEIGPNTLYMTGPHIVHEQIPVKDDPMAEYCIYFKLEKKETSLPVRDSVASKFEQTHLWFGQDTQELYPLMQQIFFELEHRYTGYMLQVETLLQQCVIKTVRNYENRQHSRVHFSPSNLVDSKYIIVEECFLYEYETITLESLAQRLGLSVRQTERFFRDYYGKTFLQKKKEAKMSMAKIYLDHDEINISEIADRLNYSSVQHFSYAFKQYYGMSATSYRKNKS